MDIYLNDTYIANTALYDVLKDNGNDNIRIGTIGDVKDDTKAVYYVHMDTETQANARIDILRIVLGQRVHKYSINTEKKIMGNNSTVIKTGHILRFIKSRLMVTEIEKMALDRNSKTITMDYSNDPWASDPSSIVKLSMKTDVHILLEQSIDIVDDKIDLDTLKEKLEKKGILELLRDSEKVNKNELTPFEYILSSGKQINGSFRQISNQKTKTNSEQIFNSFIAVICAFLDKIILKLAIVLQVIYNAISRTFGTTYNSNYLVNLVGMVMK
jgi:hypothetical protein